MTTARLKPCLVCKSQRVMGEVTLIKSLGVCDIYIICKDCGHKSKVFRVAENDFIAEVARCLKEAAIAWNWEAPQ
jgi:hypothetical protein